MRDKLHNTFKAHDCIITENESSIVDHGSFNEISTITAGLNVV